MLGEGPLVVSLPATELDHAKLPGSVFATSDLTDMKVSAPLADALEIVIAAAALADSPLIFVARPEIYTSGAGLAWLRTRLGPAAHHLMLSDGTTIRPIPGLENYAFFHGLARRSDREALARLTRRAPGLFSALAGQVNSALTFGEYSPPAIVLEGVTRPRAPAFLLPILYDPDSRESSFAHALGQRSTLATLRFDEWTYAVLTEASLDDPLYSRRLAQALNDRLFDERRAIVLRLPETVGASARLDDRIDAARDALLAAGAKFPLAATGRQWFASGDAEFSAPQGSIDFVAPADFDFWRAPAAVYRGFRSLTVHVPRDFDLAESFADVVLALTDLAPVLAS